MLPNSVVANDQKQVLSSLISYSHTFWKLLFFLNVHLIKSKYGESTAKVLKVSSYLLKIQPWPFSYKHQPNLYAKVLQNSILVFMTDFGPLTNYSLRPKLWTKYCFMKQNCQLQSGITQYENATTPVSSKAIHAAHQHYQKRHSTLFQLKGLKGYQQLKFECLDFLSKTDFTFLLC